MAFYYQVLGYMHENKDGTFSPAISGDTARSMGKRPWIAEGPFPSYFKAKAALEGKFGGIGNFDYENKFTGLVTEYPYKRFFEIFEFKTVIHQDPNKEYTAEYTAAFTE